MLHSCLCPLYLCFLSVHVLSALLFISGSWLEGCCIPCWLVCCAPGTVGDGGARRWTLWSVRSAKDTCSLTFKRRYPSRGSWPGLKFVLSFNALSCSVFFECVIAADCAQINLVQLICLQYRSLCVVVVNTRLDNILMEKPWWERSAGCVCVTGKLFLVVLPYIFFSFITDPIKLKSKRTLKHQIFNKIKISKTCGTAVVKAGIYGAHCSFSCQSHLKEAEWCNTFLTLPYRASIRAKRRTQSHHILPWGLNQNSSKSCNILYKFQLMM